MERKSVTLNRHNTVFYKDNICCIISNGMHFHNSQVAIFFLQKRLAILPFSQKLTTYTIYIAAHAASGGYYIKALPLAAGDSEDEAM